MEQKEKLKTEFRYLSSGASLTTVHGARPGPTLSVIGGVHGDEDEGVLAVHRIAREVRDLPLSGTLRAVAPAHPAAWATQSRTSPLDGGDLARCFPGDPNAGPTAATAASITECVIDGADALIDLHSAGANYSMPLMCGFLPGSPGQQRGLELARAFGSPILWAHPQSAPGRTLSAAVDRRIPAIYAECSGGSSIRSNELDAYVHGVFSVMASLTMLPNQRRLARADFHTVTGNGNLDDGARSGYDGFFTTSTTAGATVESGTEIGRLYGYQGRLLEIIDAPRSGMVMLLRRQARTRVGDVLFVLADISVGSDQGLGGVL